MRILIAIVVLAACGQPRTMATGDAPPSAGDAAIDAPSGADIDAMPDGGVAPPDPMAAFVALDPNCKTGWCWYWPTPSGNRYFDVYASAPDNIWLLAARGTIFQWNGAEWVRHHPPPLPGQDFVEMPQQVVGTGKNDMWLILMSAVEHWNGATWTIIETGPVNVSFYYHRLWIAPDTGDVYLTSNAGLERSHNGGPFTLIYPTSNMVWVWGTSSTDFFYAGGGDILHWNGTAFSQVYFEQGRFAGWMQGFKNDSWASGANATLIHWDGTSFTDIPTGLSSTTTIQAIAARAPNDVWWLFEGDSSLSQGFLHWDGTSLTATPLDNNSLGGSCCPSIAAAAIVDNRWWIVAGDGQLYTKIGANAITPLIATSYFGGGMWGTSDNDMYFAGGGEMNHWDGTTMTHLTLPQSNGVISGIAGAGVAGANELFSVGDGIDYAPPNWQYVYYGNHYDGQTWTSTELLRSPPFGPHMAGVYAIKAGEAMALGDGGRAFWYHDGVWTPIATGVTTDLQGAWGPDPDHVWVTGTHGTLLVWDRANPTVMTPDPTFPATSDDLGSIHGADGVMWVAHTQTFFVSQHSLTGWQQINTNVIVLQLFAIDARDVLVTTTDDGLISRWNGNEFIVEDNGFYAPLYYVYRPPGVDQHTWLTNGTEMMRHP